jgi:hypothetical protein
VELYTSYWEVLIFMGVTFLSSLSYEIKNKGSIPSLETIPCCGIKDRDIMEKRSFEHYTLKLWLKLCLISPWILISLNITYMVNRIG